MLTKKEIEEWYQLEEVITIADCFGVYDMRRRAQLERKMSPKQGEIVDDYIEAVEEGYGKPRTALNRARRLLLKKMWDDQMLPKRNLPDVLAELIYGIVKNEIENGKRK